jgi:hypothetical protein
MFFQIIGMQFDQAGKQIIAFPVFRAEHRRGAGGGFLDQFAANGKRAEKFFLGCHNTGIRDGFHDTGAREAGCAGWIGNRRVATARRTYSS